MKSSSMPRKIDTVVPRRFSQTLTRQKTIPPKRKAVAADATWVCSMPKGTSTSATAASRAPPPK